MRGGMTIHGDGRRVDDRADRLDQCAVRLQNVADAIRRMPGRPHGVTERLINEVEDAATAARRIVRG